VSLAPTLVPPRSVAPEHTLEGYRQAIRQGATVIELDLVSSRDGVLVTRRESELSLTTDVSMHHEFAARRTTREIDGLLVSGWFVEEFTVAELKRLTDGGCGIPTFNEVLAMVQAESMRCGCRVGVVAELRRASYSASIGLPLDVPLLADLRRHGLDHAGSRVTVACDETAVLREFAERTTVPLVQLAQYFGSRTQATT
jgi:glycerophosphoryl diester phosphodiesterase